MPLITEVTKRHISYAEYGELVQKLTDKLRDRLKDTKIKVIGGIPRGGMAIAQHLGYHLEDLLDEANGTKMIICDDVCDSGKTFIEISRGVVDHDTTFASLFIKPRSKSRFEGVVYVEEVPNHIWLHFPWEKSDEADKDYMFEEG